MLECLIIGDDIAVGTHPYRPACTQYAKNGLNSKQFNQQFKNVDLTAGVVIISLGSNDFKGIKTYDELFEMRQRVVAYRVYWVLPNGLSKVKGEEELIKIQDQVIEVAHYYGDVVLPIRQATPDYVHPTPSGYYDIVLRAL
jgi:lysophospholipase L1-like esterase